MLAKAVANESNVPFLSMNGSEFIEMIGNTILARALFVFPEGYWFKRLLRLVLLLSFLHF